ncbi:MAG: GNAT family N-acetyltransferase [Pseudomonadota bacterium]
MTSKAGSNYLRSRNAGLSFRKFNQRDMEFLEALYASTRADEVAQAGWSDEQANEFLSGQFKAQHSHYQEHYPDADWLVVIKQRERIGRLYLERWPTQHRLIDIALIPESQKQGLGVAMILDLMDESKQADKDLSLHVEKFNPARDLYASLGFEAIEDKGVYDLMRWGGASKPEG